MAWQAKVTNVSIDGGNAVAEVEFHDPDTGKLFTDKTWGDNLTLEYLKDWAAKKIASLSSRDSAVESLKSLVGQSLTPEAKTDKQYAAFRLAVAKRRGYLALGDKFSEQIATQMAIIEAYLADFPDAITEVA